MCNWNLRKCNPDDPTVNVNQCATPPPKRNGVKHRIDGHYTVFLALVSRSINRSLPRLRKSDRKAKQISRVKNTGTSKQSGFKKNWTFSWGRHGSVKQIDGMTSVNRAIIDIRFSVFFQPSSDWQTWKISQGPRAEFKSFPWYNRVMPVCVPLSFRCFHGAFCICIRNKTVIILWTTQLWILHGRWWMAVWGVQTPLR